MIVVSGVMTFKPSIHDLVVDSAANCPPKRWRNMDAAPTASGRTPTCAAGSGSSKSGTARRPSPPTLAAPHFTGFGQSFSAGDLIDMDVHRYIEPEVEYLF